MKYAILFIGTIGFFLFSNQSKAQFNETIRTGRPGQSIGPFTVGAGVFQNQTGLDLSGNTTSSSDIFNEYAVNSVFRYGLITNFEVSGVLTYNSVGSQNYLSQLDFGGRTNIHQGKGLIPSVGFQYRIAVPLESSDFKSPNDDPESKIVVVTGQSITDRLGLNINLGVNWVPLNPTASYVFSFSYSINDTWGAVAEFYGTCGQKANVDGGISYLVNNNLQLDLFGGYGENVDSPLDIGYYFVSTGVSWRLFKK